jgi:hypothetical protein
LPPDAKHRLLRRLIDAWAVARILAGTTEERRISQRVEEDLAGHDRDQGRLQHQRVWIARQTIDHLETMTRIFAKRTL